MTRVLVVQHDRDCPPALVGEWLVEAGCEVHLATPYDGSAVPALDGHEALVVLGGPMGANDDAEHPWLGVVKERIREAVGSAVPVLGICLGHQLAATALGGTVEVNPRGQQVGLLEVGWTAAAAQDPLVGPLATTRRGIHWNNDVVTHLPPGAAVLAEAPGGEPQVVRFAPLAWGLQLHPEATAAIVRRWAEDDHASHEARGIDQEALLAGIAAARDELRAAWRPLAHRFASIAHEPAGRTGLAEAQAPR